MDERVHKVPEAALDLAAGHVAFAANRAKWRIALTVGADGNHTRRIC